MTAVPSPSGARSLLPLAAAVVLLLGLAIVGRGWISLEAVVRHRAEIGAFVATHRPLAILVFVAIYIVTVTLSIPGATVLTISGGFLFGLVAGITAAIVGATIGATLVFLVARSAFGEPILRRVGPRAAQLAKGFREDAFSYLLFLRLVPAFPFFLVNLVPAIAGVRLAPFVAATALGMIPAAAVYSFAGTGLDSVIEAQSFAYRACLARGGTGCHLAIHARDVLTPQLLAALVALGLLALVPVVVKQVLGRSRTAK